MSKKKTTEENDTQAEIQNADSSDVNNDIFSENNSHVFPDSESKAARTEGKTPAEGKTDSDSDTAQKLSLMNDKYLRLLAEYDNYRKRSVREVEEAHHIATVNLIQELLPILDNLDRATEHRDDKTTLEEYGQRNYTYRRSVKRRTCKSRFEIYRGCWTTVRSALPRSNHANGI